jgi:hypothetical protein
VEERMEMEISSRNATGPKFVKEIVSKQGDEAEAEGFEICSKI